MRWMVFSEKDHEEIFMYIFVILSQKKGFQNLFSPQFFPEEYFILFFVSCFEFATQLQIQNKKIRHSDPERSRRGRIFEISILNSLQSRITRGGLKRKILLPLFVRYQKDDIF